jgi:hypothetical protein
MGRLQSARFTPLKMAAQKSMRLAPISVRAPQTNVAMYDEKKMNSGE